MMQGGMVSRYAANRLGMFAAGIVRFGLAKRVGSGVGEASGFIQAVGHFLSPGLA